MKHIRFKYVFLVIFAFLFVNLLSINVSKVSAEDQNINLDNVYRGEISNYWVLANYGEDYVGDRDVTFFLDPSAIDNENIKYIVITEMDEYGYHHPVSYKRGVDSNFASRFTYRLVDDIYGKRLIAIFLMESLSDESSNIVDKIIIDRLERVRTIEHLSSADFVISKEVEEMTFNPYKIYVDIKNNACDYKVEEVRFSYYSSSKEEMVYGNAIKDTSEGAPCNRFYFVVSENGEYNIEIEDSFGFIRPESGDSLSVVVDNFYGDVLNLIATYDDRLTRNDVIVEVEAYKADGSVNTDLIELKYLDLNGTWHDIISTKVFKATDNGVYEVYGKTNSDREATIYVNITNIDREAPLVQVSSNLKVNTSEVEGGINNPPSGVVLVFNPSNYVLATDNKTSGDILYDRNHFSAVYRYVSDADLTCKTYVGNVIEHSNIYDYLYGVNDVCVEFTISDEAGNSRTVATKISMFDDTIPTIDYSRTEITIEIGDEKPSNEELERLFGLTVNDNSRRYHPNSTDPKRAITIDGDMSKVNVEELNRYPVYITATDASGNESETVTLTVIVTVKILRITTEATNPYIVYGDELPEEGIPFSCNGLPCEEEILPADWNKLSGELYIPSGSVYAGTYPISSSLSINSKKYSIELQELGVFTIKQRTFKIVADSFKIYYLDEEPVLTWYLDTSVCNRDLSTLYTSFFEMNYSCSFADSRDYFGGGISEYSVDASGRVIYKGGILREEGNEVLFDDNGNVTFYKINIGNLKVVEANSGGRINYAIDYYGLDYAEKELGNTVLIGGPVTGGDGALTAGKGYGQFYIYPKHIEITMQNVHKIYGESDPNTTYSDEFTNKVNELTGGSYQYEFTCRAFDKDDGGPVQDWCNRGSDTYSLARVHDLLNMSVTRDEGESIPLNGSVGRYLITGHASNINFKIEFNSELSSGPVDDAYLIINKRDIEISIDGENNDGKYTIYYEDPLPYVTFTNNSEFDEIPYNGLAKGEYRNINDLTIMIKFNDEIDNGENPVKFLDKYGNPISNSIGGYPAYVDGVGIYTITNDTITIVDLNTGEEATHNYNLTFRDGILEVIQRLIYVKVVDGLNKVYGDNDPVFNSEYILNTYPGKSNYILEKHNNYVLQIINTVENSDIVDRDDYEPFDKDKLVYDLERNRDSLLFESSDVHEGETVGSYPVILQGFEYTNNQESNYIIKIFTDYNFAITPRKVAVNISDGIIEFNYQNKIPKFSYSYEGLVFGDALIGQPNTESFEGSYRNNGRYAVGLGSITALNVQPAISSVDNYWYINGVNTHIKLEDFPVLDFASLNINDGKYQLVDVANSIVINTDIEVSEINMMWNYEFEVGEGELIVIPRNVIIVPLEDDSNKKQYGDKDPVDNPIKFTTKHYVDGVVIDSVEAILDYTDFEGQLSRERGEKPGKYQITEGSLASASKGEAYNFNIIDIEEGHYFEITKRDLMLKYVESFYDEARGYYIVEKMYGEEDIGEFTPGYNTISGSIAVSDGDANFCTLEMVDGEEICLIIGDEVVGSLSVVGYTGNIGTYRISHEDLSIVRIENKNVNVEDYYNFGFVETYLEIIPRVLYITPKEGQTKIYGDDGQGECEIEFTYMTASGKTFHLIEDGTDRFSGCLTRQPIIIDDVETTEDVGQYMIGLGSLTVSGNYELILQGDVRYQILRRSLIISAKVTGDSVIRSTENNVTTFKMEYGYDFAIGYDIGGDGLADNPNLGIRDYMINDVSLRDVDGNVVDPSRVTIGTYAIVQGALIVTNPRNYIVTYMGANFVITEREVVILPHALSKVYGDEDPEVIGFDIVDEDEDLPTPTGELSRIAGENVGEYLITVGTLSFGTGYRIVFDNTYFSITKRNVTVKAHNASKIYGYEDPKLTFEYSVEGGFELDTPWFGKLARKEGEDVGEYDILQNTLDLNNNYNINYIGATFTISYIELSAIEIYSLTDNKYQVVGSESEVRLYARFNKGADESYLKDVVWSVVKSGVTNISYTKDVNNVIAFTPAGSPGNYLVTASYNGISAIYEVVVRTNNVNSITIGLVSGNVTQVLGLETAVEYSADVILFDNNNDDVVIEWYAGSEKVCEHKLKGNSDKCSFVPNNLGIGAHQVYAKIGSVESRNRLILTIKDNAAPRITLVDQDTVYYIEVFTNSISTKTPYQEPGYSANDDVDGDLTSQVIRRGIDLIDYYTVGTYYVIYEVSDQHGHVANNYRTIVVRDTVAPTVTLNRPELSEIIIEFGNVYTEFYAIATDEYDNYHGKEVEVYINSNLDINKIGVYEIIYFAIDSNGLRGQAIRTVVVQDTIPPTITLIGDEVYYVEYNEMFRDPGAWFDDNYDGRYIIYPRSITFTPEGSTESEEVNSVDTNRLGIYSLNYYQEDSSGNVPTTNVIRTVIVRDSTPPVITLLGSNPFILRYGTKYEEPGFRVIDNYDGDITDNLELVTVLPVIGDTLGTYYVYYNARDSHNNIAIEVKRTVIILDLVSPIIYFTSACPQYMTVEALVEEYDLRCNVTGYGYTVYDDYTPDIDWIQGMVNVTGTVDNTTVGVYEIHYNVSDRSGNEAVTLIRYVNVVDTTPPTVELMPNEDGDIDFYVEVFSQYVEPGYIAHDIYDDYHGIEIVVTVTNNVNINKLNTYTVTYIATDSNGNESEPVYREITVRDTVPPEVTLIGDAELIIERGGSYPEYYATARDNYDGILRDISIENAPTGKEYGHYDVKYCAVDSSGNKGCTTRHVFVNDTIAPTVLGVENGAYYRAPRYIYYTPLTGTDEILTGKLNGELITSDWYVSKDGIYTLEVHDDAGNKTTVNFVIDRVAPELYGANDGEYINHTVNLFSDEKLKSITYRLNNGGFVTTTDQSVVFEKEGQYWVYATDMAGNVSGIRSFIIDTTPPAYTLEGVLNGGITNGDVYLTSEAGVTVSVNNQYIPTVYTFTENGYYKVTIRDIAANDVFLQFVINKNPTVTISNNSVTFISQNNAIGEFVAKANKNYPKGAGFIYAKPLIDGTFEYISGTLFSDEEYSKLINGEDLTFKVPQVGEDEMVVAFIVTLDELNKFTTQTVEGDDDSAIKYAFIAAGVAGLVAVMFYFFIVVKRKKDEEDEEEEIIEEDNYY